MSFPTYGSFREQIPTDTVTVSIEPGGSLDTAYNGNAYIQFQNRAGRNLLSDPIPISVPAGSIAVFTFNEGLIESGEEVFWIVLSLGSSPQNAIMVARIATTEADQITKKPFPLVIRLTASQHFSPSSVSGISDLPSTDIIFGQIVLVTDEATYYIYDEWSLSWQPFPDSRSAYLESTTAPSGCDRLLTDVDSALRVPTKVGSNDTIPLRVWWLNGFFPDGGSPVEANTRLSLEISVNGSTTSVDGKSFSTLFSNRIKASLVGYVERATGILDLSQAQGTTIWNPVSNFLVLPEELPRGYAAVWNLVLSFENEVMLGVISSGASIDINLVEVSENVGTPSPLAALIGDLVFTNGERLRIVPTPKRLSGLASIKTGYTINSSKELPFPGLLAADTANQRITLLGSLNGFIQVRQAGEGLLPDEIVRAVASTEAGKGQLLSTPISVGAGSAIEVTVVHPRAVRNDYPDVIASNDKADYTPSVGRVGIAHDGTYYEENNVRSLGTGESITFIITDLTDFTVTTMHTPDVNFDLFRSESITATGLAGAGSLGGVYVIHFFAEYESPNTSITKITHDPGSGAIAELEGSLVDLEVTVTGGELGGGDPYLVVNSTAQFPQAIGEDAIACGENAVVEGIRSIAVGTLASAGGNNSISIGEQANAQEFWAIALGTTSWAQGNRSVAMGYNSSTFQYGSIAVGANAQANSPEAIALGWETLSNGFRSIAIGSEAIASGLNSLALGYDANTESSAGYAVQIGQGTNNDENTLQFLDTKIANNISLEIASIPSNPNGNLFARRGTLLFDNFNDTIYVNNDAGDSWTSFRANTEPFISEQFISEPTTIPAPAEIEKGKEYRYFLIQDSTGGHEINWASEFVFPIGFTLPTSSLAGSTMYFKFVGNKGKLYFEFSDNFSVPVFFPSPPLDMVRFWSFDDDSLIDTVASDLLGLQGSPDHVFAPGVQDRAITRPNFTGGAWIVNSVNDNLPLMNATSTWVVWVKGSFLFQVTRYTSSSSFSSHFFSLSTDASSAKILVNSFNQSSSFSSSFSVSPSDRFDNFVSVIVERSKSGSIATWKIYLDGTLFATANLDIFTSPSSAPTELLLELNLSLRPGVDSTFDQLRIYDRALTAQEINDLSSEF